MNLEQILSGAAPRHWVTRRAVVLDWHKGPRSGVCALSHPSCEFSFHLFAEPVEAGLSAVRLFVVSELPSGAVTEIEALLRDLGRPVEPIWVPVWNIADDGVRCDIESRLHLLLVAARPTALLAATGDWLHFDGCWNADTIPSIRHGLPPA
jgi:hypothetical protein